jgi:phosphatidylglycerophosphate synthase
MLDARLREHLAGPLDRIAATLDRRWITPDRLTAAGLVTGLGSAAAAAAQWWWPALLLWLVSRFFDGVDGALARRRHREGCEKSEAGGFFDIVADFVVYGATVAGVAVGATVGFGAPWWPFVLVLLAYYFNGAAFLAFSSIAERTGRRIDDGRSLSFLGRIAEGAETIAVHTAWLVVPQYAWQIAAVWSLFVFASAAQRMIVGYHLLR